MIKLIILLSLSFFYQFSFAGITYENIYTTGRGTGFCDGGPQSWYCFEQVKSRAKDDAVYEAENLCLRAHGRLDRYSAFCNYHCSPFSLQPDDPTQYVQCQSSCNSRCEIRTNP